MANLIIPVGVPGCGKSTWAKQFFDLKYTVVSSDDIRRHMFGSLKAAHVGQTEAKSSPNNGDVFRTFHRRIDDCLRHGVDVIADATNLQAFAREKLRDLAQYSQAKTHLVIFKNVLQAYERNTSRDEDARVPSAVMGHMTDQYYNMLAEVAQEHYDSVTRIESYK